MGAPPRVSVRPVTARRHHLERVDQGYSESVGGRSRAAASRSRWSARWLRSSAARSRSSRSSWPGGGALEGHRACSAPGPPPDPGVIDRQGRDPLALGLLDGLWARSASFRDDDLACLRSCWNAASGSPPGWRPAPLACSIQTLLARACRSWATSAPRLHLAAPPHPQPSTSRVQTRATHPVPRLANPPATRTPPGTATPLPNTSPVLAGPAPTAPSPHPTPHPPGRPSSWPR